MIASPYPDYEKRPDDDRVNWHIRKHNRRYWIVANIHISPGPKYERIPAGYKEPAYCDVRFTFSSMSVRVFEEDVGEIKPNGAPALRAYHAVIALIKHADLIEKKTR